MLEREQERGGGGLLEQAHIRGLFLARDFPLLMGTSRFCISARFLLLSQVKQPTKEWPMPSRAADTEFPGTDGETKPERPRRSPPGH